MIKSCERASIPNLLQACWSAADGAFARGEAGKPGRCCEVKASEMLDNIHAPKFKRSMGRLCHHFQYLPVGYWAESCRIRSDSAGGTIKLGLGLAKIW